MKDIKIKTNVIKLPDKVRRILFLVGITLIGIAIILMTMSVSSGAGVDNGYKLSVYQDASSNLIYGTITANSNYTHTSASLIVYYGNSMLGSPTNFTGGISFQLPMTPGSYILEVVKANGSSVGGILFYQQISGGLSSTSSTSLFSILQNVAVIGGLLGGMLIISIVSNLLFIRRLTSEGFSAATGLYSGAMEDSEVHEHKKTLTEPMTPPSMIAEWLKQKRYITAKELSESKSEVKKDGSK